MKRYAVELSFALFVALFLTGVGLRVAEAATCCSPFPVVPSTTNLVLVPPAYTNAVVLVANTAQTAAIPAGANWVVLSAGCNFFATGDGTTATVPGATTTNGSASMQNPTAWNLRGIRSISVIAAGACIVTLSFYA